MSNQPGPLKGFRPLKSTDSSTPQPENPPSPTPPISPNSTSYQPNQGFVRPSIINTTTSSQQKLICPFCSSPIPEGASFCSKCGNPLPKSGPESTQPLDIRCPRCGASNLPGISFCTKCGTFLGKLNSLAVSVKTDSDLPNNKQKKHTNPKTDAEHFPENIANNDYAIIKSILLVVCLAALIGIVASIIFPQFPKHKTFLTPTLPETGTFSSTQETTTTTSIVNNTEVSELADNESINLENSSKRNFNYPTDKITVDNISKVTQLYRIGNGLVHQIVYSPNGKKLAAATSIGIYLY